jgi:DNA-binding PadR family transcriptional regulator
MRKENPGTTNPKARKKLSNDKGDRKPTKMSVPWGRSASEYRPGLFIKQYFVEHGETCAADIYRALSEEIERLNQERIEIVEKPFRRPNYSSFSRYFHWFKLLGLIEPVDRREPAIYDFLEQRVFYRLTDKGKTEVRAWEDPVRVAHPEFR